MDSPDSWLCQIGTDEFHSVQELYPLCDGPEHQDHDDNKSPEVQELKSIPGPRHSQFRIVQEFRDEVLMTRLSLRELRTRVGRQRANIRAMEVKLWDEIRSHRTGTRDLDVEMVEQLHEDISQALDVLGPEEEDYNEKEDDLNVLEARLGDLEAELYNEITTGLSEQMGRSRSSTTIFPTRNSTATMHSEETRPETDVSSPMYRYLTRLGDARIIRERLYELRSEKSQYLDTQRDREALGHPQYQPNIEFLTDYEKAFNEELSQLQIVSMDVAKLAREAGLEPPNLSGELLNDAMHTDSSHIATPNLRSQKIAAIPARPRFGISDDPVGAPQRINQWILDRLIDCPIERARHKAIFENPFLNDKDWLQLILEYWQKDRLAISPDNSGPNTSKITMPPGDRRPNVSSTSNFSAGPHYQKVASSFIRS